MENPLSRKIREAFIRILKTENMIITKEGEFFKVEPLRMEIRKGTYILVWEILKLEDEPWKGNENKINLIDFANIPINKREKKEKQEEESHLKRMFQLLEGKGSSEQQLEEEEEEEENYDSQRKKEDKTIKWVSHIFLDDLERQWIRKQKSGDSIKVGHIQNEEVWSIIRLQRRKELNEQDYVNWPLEIKIFDNEIKGMQRENGIKVFPAILRNVRRGGEEEKRILENYGRVQEIIKNRREGKQVEALKCELSIARNGERQTWNTEC